MPQVEQQKNPSPRCFRVPPCKHNNTDVYSETLLDKKNLVVSLPCGHWALNIVHLPIKCYPVSFELLDHIPFKVFLSSDLEEQSGYASPFLWLFAVTRLIWVHISGF